jgi:hypothetical protein
MAEMPTNCYKKENKAKADSPGRRPGAEISPDRSGRVARPAAAMVPGGAVARLLRPARI